MCEQQLITAIYRKTGNPWQLSVLRWIQDSTNTKWGTYHIHHHIHYADWLSTYQFLSFIQRVMFLIFERKRMWVRMWGNDHASNKWQWNKESKCLQKKHYLQKEKFVYRHHSCGSGQCSQRLSGRPGIQWLEVELWWEIFLHLSVCWCLSHIFTLLIRII